MFLKKFLSVVALFVFVFQTQIFAATIRVPYDASTIYAAALQANAYDVIEVYNGTHYITQTVDLEDDHLTLRAAPGNYPVIVVNVTHPVNSQGLLIARGWDGVDGVTVSGLYFQVTKGLAIWISCYSKNTTIEDCSFNIDNSNAGAAITAIEPQFSPTDEINIDGCEVWGNSGSTYAIDLRWTGSTYFVNNSIYNMTFGL